MKKHKNHKEQIRMARVDLANRVAEFQASFEYGKALRGCWEKNPKENPSE